MARIALDAMGGDHAPVEAVAGALTAAADGVEVVLVGDRTALEHELRRQGAAREVEMVHAPEAIGMGEDPARAIREKSDSSVVTCARLVSDGEVGGFVSAGSTGAAMAAAAIVVGRLPRVLRPTIASVFPTRRPIVVLDAGANPEVKAEHLVQFAIMGSVLSEVYLGVLSPRVGLLNIGEERSKGRPLERAAHALLESSSVNFVGNVEGRTLAEGDADVVVTDGFTGNIFLKTTEGAAAFVTDLVSSSLADIDPVAREQVEERLRAVNERLDYETYGGAHLLGVGGVVVIAHGSSSRKSIANALHLAQDGVERGLVDRVAVGIEKG